jgi:hypothetical protein
MGGDVVYSFVADIDHAPIAKRFEMVFAAADHEPRPGKCEQSARLFEPAGGALVNRSHARTP